MSLVKRALFFCFLVSLLCFYLKVELQLWVYLSQIFLVLSILNISNTFKERLPFGEFISLIFFIENCFAVTLIYLIKGDSLPVGSYYYTQVPLENYIPFSCLASQALLIGYSLVKIQANLWKRFVIDFNSIISKESLFQLLAIGIVGSFATSLNISFLGFVTYVLAYFLSCALIGLALFNRSPINVYILAGLGLNVLSAIKAGMFGSLIYFVAYYLLLYIIQLSSIGKKLNIKILIPIGILSIWLLAVLQNVKGDYREAVWTGQEEASAGSFLDAIDNNVSYNSSSDLEFYIPLIFRLNQGYQVSAVIQKVPKDEPFANGSTIISAMLDALVPRFLNPDKEEAGGRQKIARFTNIILTGGTSMNIGLLGEAYANFDQIGGTSFMFLYGIFIALFEKRVLLYSLKQPIILVLFPIFFSILVGSGTDFLMVFNAIVKSLMIILPLLYFFKRKSKKSLPEIA